MDAVQADSGFSEEIKTRALQYYNRAYGGLEQLEQRTAELAELNVIVVASAPSRIPRLYQSGDRPGFRFEGVNPVLAAAGRRGELQ